MLLRDRVDASAPSSALELGYFGSPPERERHGDTVGQLAHRLDHCHAWLAGVHRSFWRAFLASHGAVASPSDEEIARSIDCVTLVPSANPELARSVDGCAVRHSLQRAANNGLRWDERERMMGIVVGATGRLQVRLRAAFYPAHATRDIALHPPYIVVGTAEPSLGSGTPQLLAYALFYDGSDIQFPW